ncbi:hypothetical protein [Sorangium sp. So ce204]
MTSRSGITGAPVPLLSLSWAGPNDASRDADDRLCPDWARQKHT